MYNKINVINLQGTFVSGSHILSKRSGVERRIVVLWNDLQ